MALLKSIDIILITFGVLLLVPTAQSINVFLNGQLYHFNSPYSRYGRVEFNMTGAGLAVADPIELCTEQEADFTNKIVVATSTGCSPLTKIRLAQERGAVPKVSLVSDVTIRIRNANKLRQGIIAHETINEGPSGNVYWKTVDGQWAPETSLPYVTVNASNGNDIKALILNATSNDTLTADLDPFDRNDWIDVLDTSNAYMGVAIALILANAAGLGFALSRLISLIIAKGCNRTTAHLTLIFICSLHITTIIYYVVNIIDIKVGPVAPDIFYTIFLILPELFQMLSSLVVSLYWFELINSVTSKSMMFLKKLFKPFIAFAIIISVLFVGVVIFSGLYLSDLVLLIFLFFFLLLSLTVAIIWLIVGAKLIHQIRTNAKLRENKEKATNFNRLSALIILCGAFLFLTRIMYLVLGLDRAVYADPWFWLPIATLIFIFQLITALIQTGLFKLHKRDFKSTSKRSGSDRATNDSRTSRRASVHGGMHMSALATKGESVNDTLSEEQLLSGAETGRTATTAAESKPSSSEEEPRTTNNKQNNNETRDSEDRSRSSSQSQSEQEESSASSSEDNDEPQSRSESESSESESS